MTIRYMVAAAVALGVTAAAAQSDPVKERDALMKINGRHYYGTWNRMVRGQDPYDQAKVDEALAQFADTASKFGALFPENSKPTPGDTTDQWVASPRIWQNKADFEAKLAAFGAAVAEHRGKIKNLDDLKEGREAIGKTCNACHELYQMRTR